MEDRHILGNERFRRKRRIVPEGSLETGYIIDKETSSVACKACVFFQTQALLLYVVNNVVLNQ